MIIHDVIQGTDEWLHVKAGKFGGTSAKLFPVSGMKIGAGLRTAIYEKVAEHVVGPSLDGFTSAAMQRGVELEPLARKRYAVEHFVSVREVGYIQKGDYFGVSPDGLIGKDGAIEIKSPGGKEFVRWLDERTVPKPYYMQMQWLLCITGRKWCDYVVFNPDFADCALSVERVHRDEELIALFEKKKLVVATEMDRLLNMVAKKNKAA